MLFDTAHKLTKSLSNIYHHVNKPSEVTKNILLVVNPIYIDTDNEPKKDL